MSKTAPRALVVDDDHAWQEILVELLNDAGLSVDVASSLETATNIIHRQTHRLAVVDLSLRAEDPHNEDGLAVLETLRRQDPACSSVLLTGFATVELAVTAIKTFGVFTCLQKENFQRRQLGEIVEKVLASAPPFQSGALAQAAEASSRASKKDYYDPPPPAPADQALVVEDDAGWREILAELLKDAEYRVQVCGSYGEALGYLRREKYRLAIIDLSLGGGIDWPAGLDENEFEGHRLLDTTRQEGIPTIVVSGVAAPAEIERIYQQQGIFAFLEKQSFNRHTFLKTIKEARAANHAASEIEALTGREQEILAQLAKGATNQEIAERVYISVNTVKRHLKSIFRKLDIHTRSAAAAKAAALNIPTDRGDT